MKKKIIIEGINCEYCASEVIRNLMGIKGVHSVDLNYSDKNAVVELSQEISNDKFKIAIEAAECKVVEIKEI
ncbi:heavy-metal-associated domain-containing protein [Alkaliphilus transvaalensis]|uniref:heavy-metal-associated domain-containing protein n=1 Tax=Alkaliphilus transvaalensis TaxID=114628 RepID=UPI00047DF5EB|nr:heavy metal-associated domain-containing protein [Alkaliphilus transvaalensis]